PAGHGRDHRRAALDRDRRRGANHGLHDDRAAAVRPAHDASARVARAPRPHSPPQPHPLPGGYRPRATTPALNGPGQLNRRPQRAPRENAPLGPSLARSWMAHLVLPACVPDSVRGLVSPAGPAILPRFPAAPLVPASAVPAASALARRSLV